MEKIKIYTLSDSKGIRYVGQTKNMKNRFNKHIFEAKKDGGKNKRCSWIKSVLNKGLKPKMELIDEVPFDEWAFWEKYWISQIKSWGFNLVNMTEGGEGSYGLVVTDKTKKKMSEAKKGRTPKNIKLLHKSRAKKIVQYNLKGEFIKYFNSTNEAKRILNINNIDLVVNGKRNSAGGFLWRNYDEPLSKNEINYVKKQHEKQKPKVILQIDENGLIIKEWESVGSVKKIHGHINAVLRGDRKTAGGYRWIYK